jgi:hypothetical protein
MDVAGGLSLFIITQKRSESTVVLTDLDGSLVVGREEKDAEQINVVLCLALRVDLVSCHLSDNALHPAVRNSVIYNSTTQQNTKCAP